MSFVRADGKTGSPFAMPIKLFGEPLKLTTTLTVEQPGGSSSRTPGCSMSIRVLRGTSPGRR